MAVDAATAAARLAQPRTLMGGEKTGCLIGCAQFKELRGLLLLLLLCTPQNNNEEQKGRER